jgi:hypothetical protein
MRRAGWIASLGLIVGLLATRSEAGLYNLVEPNEGPLNPDYLNQFRSTLLDLRSIGMQKVDFDNPLRRRYRMFHELGKSGSTQGLTLEQKISYGAVLVRTGQPDQAVQLLMPLSRQHPKNLPLQCNLAMAYHQWGNLRSASDHLSDTLKRVWPKNWEDLSDEQRAYLLSIGWNEGPFYENRKYELAYLKLLDSRKREPKGASLRDEQVDPLFGDPAIKYVDDQGKFSPGRVTLAERKKLPADALEIVQQLLVWMPNDLRLKWQLAEVYNASASSGDGKRTLEYLKSANLIYEELWKDQYQPRELGERRRTLREYLDGYQNEKSFPENIDLVDKNKKDDDTPRYNWSNMAVSFGAGAVFMLFASWQVREIRRRRQARQSVP